jgi:hypothetical protein
VEAGIDKPARIWPVAPDRARSTNRDGNLFKIKHDVWRQAKMTPWCMYTENSLQSEIEIENRKTCLVGSNWCSKGAAVGTVS